MVVTCQGPPFPVHPEGADQGTPSAPERGGPRRDKVLGPGVRTLDRAEAFRPRISSTLSPSGWPSSAGVECGVQASGPGGCRDGLWGPGNLGQGF